jgi:uroporphyrinogen-III synthase
MSTASRQRRLSGIRALVTRPRDRAAQLCFLLEDEGAEVIAAPLLELLPPADPRPLRSAAEQISRYSWILFASPSAVQALCDAAREAGTLERLRGAKVAVVGPGTGSAVRSLGLTVALEATERTGSGLLEAVRGVLSREDELLLPAAQDGRLELYQGLRELGIQVTRVVAYRSSPAALEPEVRDSLLSNPPQVVLFGSPRTAEALAEVLGHDGARFWSAAKAVAIGPTTAAALQALGIAVSAVAEQPTSTALVDAAVRALSR